MHKFRRFTEKTLLIISICMIAIFFVAVIVMMCIPHGKNYEFSYVIEDTEHHYEITLDKKYTEKHYYVLDGYSYNADDMMKGEYNFEVDNGELYIIDNGSTSQRQKIGSINSRELKLLNRDLTQDGHDVVLTCHINRTLTNIFVICLYLGIFLIVISIMLIIVHKHHDGKTQQEKNVKKTSKEVNEEEQDGFSSYSHDGAYDYSEDIKDSEKRENVQEINLQEESKLEENDE